MAGEKDLGRAIGRLIIGGFDGTRISADFRTLVQRGEVGGVILFKRNITDLEQTAALLAELQAIAPEPLWTAIDQEGGRVQRLAAPFPQLPPMRELAKQGVDRVRAAAKTVADGLRGLGFRQNYAPVLDVDTNPANPVIGDRSFSREPSEVARFGLAVIDGLEKQGVASCGKHFPGHGDTNKDSHFELPRLDHDLARLEGVELAPFRAACSAGVASIMTAHVLFPLLDAEHPATLSEKIVAPILRERFGYDGVVVSDDLEMKAVADHYGIDDSAVRAIRAGCDQLLICHKPELQAAAHRAILRAVESGQIARARIDEADRRVRVMKARFPLAAEPIESIAARMRALPSFV